MPYGFKPPLSNNSARFVDLIHTDTGKFGNSRVTGHIDFWPNNGHGQPGCFPKGDKLSLTCSHRRAHELFIESITTEIGFYAYACGNWLMYKARLCNEFPVLMGERTPVSASGNYYYLHTERQAPYAVGKVKMGWW